MRVLERADAMCVRSLSSRETRQRATQATAPIDRCSIQAKHGNQAGTVCGMSPTRGRVHQY